MSGAGGNNRRISLVIKCKNWVIVGYKMGQEQKLITQTEFAKKLGISQPAVHKLIKNGRIPIKDGKVIMPDALYSYQSIHDNRISASENTINKSSAGQILQQAKAAYQTYMAEIKKLELEEMRGKLISMDEATAEFRLVATLVRAELLSLPGRCAGVLEGKSINQIELILSDAVNECLTKLNDTRFNSPDTEIEESKKQD